MAAGLASESEGPAPPWLRVQGPGDASTMWYALLRKRTRGVFIGTMVLRHGEHYTSLLEAAWEEIPVEAIGSGLDYAT